MSLQQLGYLLAMTAAVLFLAMLGFVAVSDRKLAELKKAASEQGGAEIEYDKLSKGSFLIALGLQVANWKNFARTVAVYLSLIIILFCAVGVGGFQDKFAAVFEKL